MTEKEVVKLFVLLTAAYPRFDTFSDPEKTRPVIKLWAEMLADIPYEVVEVAVKKFILESSYPPTIAEIRKQAMEIATSPEDKIGSAEAWGEVERAIRLYGYYNEAEALKSMSPQTAKVVKYIGWREICLSEEPGVVRGQFLKMYEQLQERERKEALLPPDLKNEIQQISQQRAIKALESGTNIKHLKILEGGGK
jgi:hypothetical protein